MDTAGIKPSTMRAVQYSGYGGGAAALKYVEIPVPSLKKDEVLIKVEAASINPADCRIQKGLLRPFLPFKFPFIPVTDVAGEIAEVGTEVRELKVGDKVVSKLKFWKAGGLAEYVAASESVTVVRPACVSAADAAGLPMAGLTALQALKAIGTKFDGTGSASNILITAASGGIGSYAVQLAKLGNHSVTATCGARNLDLVESIGADEVLDYKTPEGAALKNSSGKKYDYIVNTTDGGKWSAFKPSLSSNGRVVDVSPNFGNFVASILTLFSKKKLSTVNLSLGMEDLSFLLELVKEGKLKMVLDSRHPFEKAADAWEKSLSGHATGKVIVEM
ncbi:chloroplast envelope quinone oxidoreductase homolog [Lolium perenne]|uniref:chloroplast envelope quinone oxidoreductase homolog n=1 Tax=Lolium perenne TaxID=4522 RepID=UPI0021EA1074|nr:chloroplast envelope quinone oxidoreductase homolog [Lolium perenne]